MATSSAESVLLARYGEIGLKGRNRGMFLDTLVHNLQAQAGPDADLEVRAHFGRIIVRHRRRSVAEDAALIDRLRRTFGVVSVSPALRVPTDLDAVLQAADAVTARHLERHQPKTFKVDTRRPNKAFPHTSLEVNTAVGRYIAERYGLDVAMERPDLRVAVEIRDRAYVYTEVLPGPGGLPVGTGGRVVALLSGGIDSPVAAWMAAKRGLVVIPVHFYSFPFVSERSREKVLDISRVLATYAGPLRVWVAHFTEVQRAIQLAVPPPLRVTIMRRMMMRIAEALARRERAGGLVTGESVGQVASQTLEGIGVIERVTTLPVLRPVVGMDKTEIVAQARAIGTYEISVLPYEDCCTLFLPEHPRTHPTVEEAERAESGLEVEGLVDEALARSDAVEVLPGEAPVLLV